MSWTTYIIGAIYLATSLNLKCNFLGHLATSLFGMTKINTSKKRAYGPTSYKKELS